MKNLSIKQPWTSRLHIAAAPFLLDVYDCSKETVKALLFIFIKMMVWIILGTLAYDLVRWLVNSAFALQIDGTVSGQLLMALGLALLYYHVTDDMT